MKKLKTLAALVAATAMAFALAACSHDSDSDSSGGTGGNTPTVRTYSEASDEEKARFAIAYDAEKLKTLSQGESELTDAITVKASIPWRVEQYGDDWDSWAILSVEKSDATEATESKISLTIEDNLAEYYASLTENDDGTVDTSRAVMPEDRTTTLHFLTAEGKQLAAVTLTQTGDVPSGEAQSKAYTANSHFLGRGYDIFTGRWAAAESVKDAQIINLEKLPKRGEGSDASSVTFQTDTSAEYTTRTGKTLTELSTAFKVNGSVSTKIFKFSGEMKAAYGKNYKETGSEEYAIYDYTARRGIYSIDTATAVDECVDEEDDENGKSVFTNNYLTNGAYKAIYGKNKKYQGSAGIRKLFETYGTHVLVSGVVGARREFTMRLQKNDKTKNMSVSAMVKVGYKSLWGSVDASVESSYEENYKNSSEYYETNTLSVGGSTDLTLKEKEWMTLLTDSNAALVDFAESSLVPIWDLCFDTERAKAIREEAMRYGIEKTPTATIIGKIVLESGKLVNPSSYTVNATDPAVGVVAYVGTGNELGKANVAYVLGLQTKGNLSFSNWSMGYGTWNINNKGNTTYLYDGTRTEEAVRKIFIEYKDTRKDPKKWIQKYQFPAFDWAANYGTTMGYTGTRWQKGWFIPSLNELKAVMENRSIIQNSFAFISSDIYYTYYRLKWFWSSSLLLGSAGYADIGGYECNGAPNTIGRASPSSKQNVLVVYPILLDDLLKDLLVE